MVKNKRRVFETEFLKEELGLPNNPKVKHYDSIIRKERKGSKLEFHELFFEYEDTWWLAHYTKSDHDWPWRCENKIECVEVVKGVLK